jgi:hypothetical protein
MRRVLAAVAATSVALVGVALDAPDTDAAEPTACDVLISKDFSQANVDAGRSQLVGSTPEVSFCRFEDGIEVTIERRTKTVKLFSGAGVEKVRGIGVGAVTAVDDAGKVDTRVGMALVDTRTAVRVNGPADELSRAQEVRLLKAAVTRLRARG